jgi:hypothetical protein
VPVPVISLSHKQAIFERASAAPSGKMPRIANL